MEYYPYYGQVQSTALNLSIYVIQSIQLQVIPRGRLEPRIKDIEKGQAAHMALIWIWHRSLQLEHRGKLLGAFFVLLRLPHSN